MIIYTFPRKWFRSEVTIEYDQDKEMWSVCRKGESFTFKTFRECLAYCEGRGLFPMHSIDYCAEHLAKRMNDLGIRVGDRDLL